MWLGNWKTSSRNRRYLLEPVRELARTAETEGVWSNGLIVFRSPDVFRYFFLHRPVPELHEVEERFGSGRCFPHWPENNGFIFSA